jgi:hypothetical protein
MFSILNKAAGLVRASEDEACTEHTSVMFRSDLFRFRTPVRVCGRMYDYLPYCNDGILCKVTYRRSPIHLRYIV